MQQSLVKVGVEIFLPTEFVDDIRSSSGSCGILIVPVNARRP